MARYEVYATRLDDPHIIEELIPARGLEFTMPLSDTGECSFSATVEPGRSFWRPAITTGVSGVLVTRDGVPVWSGWVTGERPDGPRSFQFTAAEWGSFFERVPPVPKRYSGDDHSVFRDLITSAQAISGQNVAVQVGTTIGSSTSDFTINAWDVTWVAQEFKQLADSDGGPEWYFGTGGTLENPVRSLILGDRLGDTTPQVVLEFVEDTDDYTPPQAPPKIVLLGNLFPTADVWVVTRRRGGNVIAQGRTRDVSASATVAVAIGSGEERAQLRRSAESTLLSRGWPRLTKQTMYPDDNDVTSVQRHANADLAASEGITTGYSLVTLDGEPDWTLTPRGSSVRIILDTDVYGAERPVGGPDGFDARLLNLHVNVPDDGGDAQIQWDTATVQET